MMKALLEQYLSEALSPENVEALSQALEESFATKVKEHKDEITVQLQAQFAADREALVEAMDTMVRELVNEQVEELKDDVNSFRDLEVDYANKLVEAKQAMANDIEKDMTKLVAQVDAYLEERMTTQFTALKESIDETRKNQLGLRIFEMFRPEVEKLVDIESGNEAVRLQLEEANKKLEEQGKLLKESADNLASVTRAQTMQNVLSSLHGRPREIMEAILDKVETEKLQEAYENFIPRVLNESIATKTVEKETEEKTLNENAEVVPETKVVTGDDEELKKVLKEAEDIEAKMNAKTIDAAELSELRRLAGIGSF